MSTVLKVIVRNGQVELSPDAQVVKNARALLVLLDESEQPEEGATSVMWAANRTEAWQRLSGIAATDSEPPTLSAENQMEIVRRLRGIAKPDVPPPTDEEVREMYTDYLDEKYR